jgi:hypothetical protein
LYLYLHAFNMQDLILSIADWLKKTVSHVILPSLDHYPLLPFRTRYLKFIVIRDARNRRPKFSTDLIKEQVCHSIHVPVPIHMSVL